MAKQNVDRRVRKTKKQLKDSLIRLLKEKKVQDIRVRELTDLADLNRGTFYLHYKDVFDLLKSTEDELLSEFETLLRRYDAIEMKAKPSLIFCDVYTLISDNADLFRILLGENGDLDFLNRLRQIVRETCLTEWMNVFNTGNSESFEPFLAFIVSGSIGLIQHWLHSDMKMSPGELADLTEEIITRGVAILE